jgi:hypothetical protein
LGTRFPGVDDRLIKPLRYKSHGKEKFKPKASSELDAKLSQSENIFVKNKNMRTHNMCFFYNNLFSLFDKRFYNSYFLVVQI